MKELCEGLGQSVRQSFEHDRAVVVVVRLVARARLLAAEARGHGEGPEVVLHAALLGRHEVRHAGELLRLLLRLLPQSEEGGAFLPLLILHHNVISDRVSWVESHNSSGFQ